MASAATTAPVDGIVSLFGAATGTLAQLLALAALLSVALTQMSHHALVNLPVSLVAVWAVRCLAQVRFEVRWDAASRRASVSVTREHGRSTAGEPRQHSHYNLRDSSSPEGAGRPVRKEKVSRPVSTVAAWELSAREVELRELLQQLEQGGGGRGGSGASASSSAATTNTNDTGESTPTPPPAPPPGWAQQDTGSGDTGVLGSWGRLRDHIVDEFVTGLWYRAITEDDDLPSALRRLLDASFAELAHRARAVDLPVLLLRRVPEILTQQLEVFRDARAACGGADAFTRLTPLAADRAVAAQLTRRGQLHPGAGVGAGAGVGLHHPGHQGNSTARSSNHAPAPAWDAAGEVLSRRCHTVAAALLPPAAAASPLLLPLVRELLAGGVLRPLLGFSSPLWVHRGLAHLLAPTEGIPDGGVGTKGDDGEELAAEEKEKEIEEKRAATAATSTCAATSSVNALFATAFADTAAGKESSPADAPAASATRGKSNGGSEYENCGTHGEVWATRQGSPLHRSSSVDTSMMTMTKATPNILGSPKSTSYLGPLSQGASLAPSDDEDEGGADGEEYELARMVGNDDKGGEHDVCFPGDGAVAVAAVGEDRRVLSMSTGDESTSTSGGRGSGSGGISFGGRLGAKSWLHARVVEVTIVGKGTGAYAVYTIRVHEAARSVADDEQRDASKVDSRGSGGGDWAVARRFRNFEALHRRLTEAGLGLGLGSLPLLPRKRYLLHSLDGSFVEARRRLLDAYLAVLMADARLCQCRDVREFLNAEKGAYEPERVGGGWEHWSVVGTMSGSWNGGGGDGSSEVEASGDGGKGGGGGGGEHGSGNIATSYGEGVTETVASFARSLSQAVGQSVEDATSTVSRALGKDIVSSPSKGRAPSPLWEWGQGGGSGAGAREPGSRRHINPLNPLGSRPRPRSRPDTRSGPGHRRGASVGSLPLNGVCDLDLGAAPQCRAVAAATRTTAAAAVAATSAEGDGGATETVIEDERGDKADANAAWGAAAAHEGGGAVEPDGSEKGWTTAEEEGKPRLAQVDGGGEQRERWASAVETPSSSSSTQVLMNGPLLGLFEAVFHLQAKGLVRRTIVTVARQTLEFFVGSAVEDLVSSKLRALRSPATVAGFINFVDGTLWPGGEWYQRAEPSSPSTAQDQSAAAAAAAAAMDDEEAIRLKVRDALLAAGSRGPLPGLLGVRNYTRAALDVLAVTRSELMTRQIGLLVLEAALEGLFPELEAHANHPPAVDEGEAGVEGERSGNAGR